MAEAEPKSSLGGFGRSEVEDNEVRRLSSY